LTIPLLCYLNVGWCTMAFRWIQSWTL
jgi:hypothetical protein